MLPLVTSVALSAQSERRPKEGADQRGRGRGARGTGSGLFLEAHQQGRQSRFYRFFSTPLYQSMTIRNWNTTTTLLRKMDEMSGVGIRG